MSRRVFDYNSFSRIGISGPNNLLERIADNFEREIEGMMPSDCNIEIRQSEELQEIIKDKRYDYLTINKEGTKSNPSINYIRYNTLVRTIHQKSLGEYVVDVNVELDEASGLICARNYLAHHSQLAKLPLLHASLVNLNNKGILLASNSRQGKTTLMVYLLEEQGAEFIGDENIILDTTHNQPNGLYVPRTPRVRFSTIAQSGLSKVLKNVELANATQYIDPDAIERIISSKSFHVDAGMAFSRKSFCDFLQVDSRGSSEIDLVLFPTYSSGNSLNAKKIPFDEGVLRLSNTGLTRKTDISPKELTGTQIDLSTENFRNVEFYEVSFSEINDLRKGGFKL